MPTSRFHGDRRVADFVASGLSGRCCIVLAAGCVLFFSGCGSVFGGKDSLALDNPFEKPKNLLSALAAKPKQSDKEARRRAAKYGSEMAAAHSLEQSQKYVEARAAYERLITSNPDRYESYHKLGVLADRQRRYREAQALYTEAVRLNPRNPELFNDLGYCLYLQGKLDKAEASLLKAVTMAPSNSRYRNNLGMVLGHQDRYEDALEHFRRAGSEADAYFNLAFILATRENAEGAKNCFRLALAVDPTYERARRALASFEHYENDPTPDLDNTPIVEDGIRWVSYKEGMEDGQSEVQPAGYTSESDSNRIVPSTRANSKSLMKRARTLMSEQMADKQQPSTPGQ